MARNTLPITKLASGRFQARYRDDTGRQRAKTFEHHGEAKKFLEQTRADMSRGTWIDPDDSSMTFREYSTRWLAAQSSAFGTRALIESNLRSHLLPVIGDVPLGRLRMSQLQALVTGLSTKSGNPLQRSTAQVVRQHLVQILSAAVHDRMILANPAKGVKVAAGGPVELVVPDPDEVQTILATIDDRSRGLVAVGAGLGLRQGEAFGLSGDRVDFLRRTVKIDRQLVRLQRGTGLGRLKTPRSYRTIPLPESVGLELARHIERYPSDDPDGLLFQAAQGGRIRRDGWNRRTWKPATAAAGRPDLGFHALRHFYASALIRSGLSAPAVARRLGNSPQMVLSTYAHLWRDDDDRTREAIDGVLTWRSTG